ncbi:hypothetical protein INR49_021092 [Caranx melampygus]|nr:hypothetical protein INR49_021092 [Caranx melampygus]
MRKEKEKERDSERESESNLLEITALWHGKRLLVLSRAELEACSKPFTFTAGLARSIEHGWHSAIPIDLIEVLSKAANLTPLCRSTVKQNSKHQANTVFYLILDEEQWQSVGLPRRRTFQAAAGERVIVVSFTGDKKAASLFHSTSGTIGSGRHEQPAALRETRGHCDRLLCPLHCRITER